MADDAPKKKGFSTIQYRLSDALADVVGEETMTRPQVVKQIWVYIKGNDLQNPEDKREILCDDKLKELFDEDKISMFKMQKALQKHFLEKLA
mmetsp:Transcript_18699/g.25693  ORF Transcript_18699/g.25693 Transcript_18699/m.25693 type:complete len:92 (-) Transcript_18699:286-561(-)|eukprot:CAMPEP_0194577870 /NCGR_PEP_ID=MMETSP0292-20121207/12489_1 /TAXON_ID=39354 /ORGANISM="Heterosigma akashiwo, Strain CCMP2393" /LENGTH=91 /DNA_ID=CAMNT_0039430359 /DNA_START=156 /DNA_END=431 /DNA_ORIENTATION=+